MWYYNPPLCNTAPGHSNSGLLSWSSCDGQYVHAVVTQTVVLFCGVMMPTVQDIFYSHYSFQKPHLQQEPHQSFEKEVRKTRQVFVNLQLKFLALQVE